MASPNYPLRQAPGGSLAPGDVLARKYRLIELLGQGSMATVWVAENIALETHVAIKVLRESLTHDARLVSRVRREARTTASIAHKNIVQVFDYGLTSTGAPFIVMELLQGETLAARLKSRGRLPPREAVHLLLRAMKGITIAHAKGIIHRDLKPENIFLSLEASGAERPKVLDFGISFVLDDTGNETRVTRTGVLLGTPAYLAPELIRGARAVDAGADIWALGVILYEMITGVLPFVEKPYHALLHAIVHTPHRPLREVVPGLDPRLQAIVKRALEKDPDLRYRTVRELFDALNAWLGHFGPPLSDPVLSKASLALASNPHIDDEEPTLVGDSVRPMLVSPKKQLISPVSEGLSALSPVSEGLSAPTPLNPFEGTSALGEIRASPARSGLRRKPKKPVLSVSSPTQPQPLRWAVLALVALGVLGLLGGVLGYRLHTSLPTTISNDRVQLDVTGLPQGTVVFINGEQVAMPASLQRGAAIHMRVQAPGYFPWSLDFIADRRMQLPFAGKTER